MSLHRVITADSYPDKTGQELIEIHWQNVLILVKRIQATFALRTPPCSGLHRVITAGSYPEKMGQQLSYMAKRTDSCNKNTGNFRLAHIPCYNAGNISE